MIRKIILTALLATNVLMNSCDILQQVERMKMLSKCEFRIHTITDIHLAEVNLSGIKQVNDIKTTDLLQLTQAVLSNELPLRFKVNLQVKNPNNQAASLNRLEWMLFVDNKQMLDGVVNENFVTGPGETGTLPVSVNLNLAELLQDKQIEQLINYASGLADGTGKSTRVMVKLKPSIMVGQQSIPYPGWLEVRHDFTAE
ncbi:MAG TPA: LEA type 2 family protein [Bacteroidales bacterium]|nr:LEA type 2 family protein [Bacteroidales bacterium]